MTVALSQVVTPTQPSVLEANLILYDFIHKEPLQQVACGGKIETWKFYNHTWLTQYCKTRRKVSSHVMFISATGCFLHGFRGVLWVFMVDIGVRLIKVGVSRGDVGDCSVALWTT